MKRAMVLTTVFTLTVLPISGHAAEPLRLEIDAAVDLAIQKSPALESARLGRDVSRASVNEVRARFVRSLRASSTYRHNRSPSVSRLEQVDESTTRLNTYALNLLQPLRTGGSVLLSVDQSRTANNR